MDKSIPLAFRDIANEREQEECGFRNVYDRRVDERNRLRHSRERSRSLCTRAGITPPKDVQDIAPFDPTRSRLCMKRMDTPKGRGLSIQAQRHCRCLATAVEEPKIVKPQRRQSTPLRDLSKTYVKDLNVVLVPRMTIDDYITEIARERLLQRQTRLDAMKALSTTRSFTACPNRQRRRPAKCDVTEDKLIAAELTGEPSPVDLSFARRVAPWIRQDSLFAGSQHPLILSGTRRLEPLKVTKVHFSPSVPRNALTPLDVNNT